jgi:DNA-binding transcriptional LysR family regulator
LRRSFDKDTVELYRLRTFVAVARLGHLTRAAEALHVSQPTVTGQLKALEQELGVPLFTRKAHGVVLTPWGQKLLSTATSVIATVDDFVQSARAQSGSVGRKLRVGIIVNPEFLRLGEITSRVRTRRPDVELEFHQSLSSVIRRDIQRRELDGGFFLGTVQQSSVHAIHLTSVEFRVIAPAAWKRRIEAASWQDLAKLPWVCTPKGGAFRKLSSRFFRRHNMKPATVTETDRESTILNLVAAGVGLGFVRADALPLKSQRAGRILQLPGSISTGLYFLFAAGRQEDRAVVALVDAVRAAWKRE